MVTTCARIVNNSLANDRHWRVIAVGCRMHAKALDLVKIVRDKILASPSEKNSSSHEESRANTF